MGSAPVAGTTFGLKSLGVMIGYSVLVLDTNSVTEGALGTPDLLTGT